MGSTVVHPCALLLVIKDCKSNGEALATPHNASMRGVGTKMGTVGLPDSDDWFHHLPAFENRTSANKRLRLP